MGRFGRIVNYGILVVAAIAVTACQESEQDRPLSYDKGVYQGPQDEKLTEEQLQQLRLRSRLQSGGSL